MAENSAIEWTDHTWTPVVGCDPVSPACAKCYAALMAARLEAMGQAKYAGIATRHGNLGKWTGKVTLWEPDLLKPLGVKKPARWFLTSMGDIGHDKVAFDFLDRIFAVMAMCPQHTFYVLTKRPGRIARYLSGEDCRGPTWSRKVAVDAAASVHGTPFAVKQWPLSNVLIGCTAEDQPRADERRTHLERIAYSGWRTFVSYEPALGPVDWTGWAFLAWMISGGESGPGARPSHPDWHRATRDWCAKAGIPYMFKQWGEWAPRSAIDRDLFAKRSRGRPCWSATSGAGITDVFRVGKKAAGRLLDAVEHNGFPESSHG